MSAHTEDTLLIENRLLKTKNKILVDLCAEHTAKYHALQAKTKQMELENESLRETLEQQSKVESQYIQICMEHDSLKQKMTNLQIEHINLDLEHNEWCQTMKSLQNKIHFQTTKLQSVTDHNSKLQTKFYEIKDEFSKMSHILLEKNKIINDLQELQRINQLGVNHVETDLCTGDDVLCIGSRSRRASDCNLSFLLDDYHFPDGYRSCLSSECPTDIIFADREP
eukprot:504037_1